MLITDELKKELNNIKNAFLGEIHKGLDQIKTKFNDMLRTELHEVKDIAKNMTLEQITYLIHKTGQEYAEFKQISDRMEELKKVKMSRLKMHFIEKAALEHKRISMNEAETMALSTEGANSYEEFIKDMILQTKRTEQAKIKYEAYKNLFEAKRTFEVTEREKLKKGVYNY